MGKKGKLALLGVAVIVLILVGIRISGSREQPKLPDVGKFDDYATQLKWGRYVNTKYKIVFPYPLSWSMNTTTLIFEDGDLITVEFLGPTQKERAEFYDGARFTVMIPQKTDLDLSGWIAEKHKGLPGEKPPDVNDVQLNGRNFKKVYTCGLGCFTYYYTTIDGQVYGVMTFADGPQKTGLEAILKEMLAKLELGSN
ncbi:MAG: hypothetical protein HYW45_03245 [Candidatus Daviesbacteria bacterium]|nr:MAG: hypothetical protein HYW45_03245 [Candidatus Daviesbacteria bacterium]